MEKEAGDLKDTRLSLAAKHSQMHDGPVTIWVLTLTVSPLGIQSLLEPLMDRESTQFLKIRTRT